MNRPTASGPCSVPAALRASGGEPFVTDIATLVGNCSPRERR
ncbi:hypothetical protein SBD_2250 [Streptomyces bottropensis ATCC 25435]|uniref:Uncharacterized protein n=1 Tax=Streptomyces bottropensis ATCC 25435 TaxID=1054862 RepID=M3FTQ3_9ACTN|nr:hypothetical protein SBD_2250 [Streptomyces bottropensis ATCC 25435]